MRRDVGGGEGRERERGCGREGGGRGEVRGKKEMRCGRRGREREREKARDCISSL